MDYINMSIGETLKNRRIELGIKQEAVAEEMGVTVQTIYKWEKGTTEPKASQVCKLSQVLKLTEKEICQGKQDNMDNVEALEFVRRVGILMSEVPQTEMLFGMHKYIIDKKGFLKMLASVSNYPYELFDIERKQDEQANAALQLQILESGNISNIDEIAPEKLEEYRNSLIKIINEE